MNRYEYNKLKSLSITLQNAFSQTDLFWMKEILASGLISLDAMVNSHKKVFEELEPIGEPCPQCNPTGVFNYSPVKNCICEGRAFIVSKH